MKVSGRASVWNVTGDEGTVKEHAFCPSCGTPAYLTFATAPDFFLVHAGSLDDPSRYKPQMLTYAIRGHAWDKVDPALAKFDRMPPR